MPRAQQSARPGNSTDHGCGRHIRLEALTAQRLPSAVRARFKIASFGVKRAVRHSRRGMFASSLSFPVVEEVVLGFVHTVVQRREIGADLRLRLAKCARWRSAFRQCSTVVVGGTNGSLECDHSAVI